MFFIIAIILENLAHLTVKISKTAINHMKSFPSKQLNQQWISRLHGNFYSVYILNTRGSNKLLSLFREILELPDGKLTHRHYT